MRILENLKNTNPPPYLVVGLGNPDKKFKNNRHNVGFMVVDQLAAHLEEKFSKVKFESMISQSHYADNRLIIAKPRTYMNRSGRAVASLVRFFKVPAENLIVVYDDVDLPFDSLRLRPEGGSAGQKGMRSIIESLGTQHFARLRVGIGKPKGRLSTPSHVLQDFSKKELEILPIVLKEASEAILTFVEEGIVAAMNKHNRSDR